MDTKLKEIETLMEDQNFSRAFGQLKTLLQNETDDTARLKLLLKLAICSCHTENERRLDSSITEILRLMKTVPEKQSQDYDEECITLFQLLKKNGCYVRSIKIIFAWFEVIKRIPYAKKQGDMTTVVLCLACDSINEVLSILKSCMLQYIRQIQDHLKCEALTKALSTEYVNRVLLTTEKREDELLKPVPQKEVCFMQKAFDEVAGCWADFEFVKFCLNQDPWMTHLMTGGKFEDIASKISQNGLSKENLSDPRIVMASEVLLSRSAGIGADMTRCCLNGVEPILTTGKELKEGAKNDMEKQKFSCASMRLRTWLQFETTLTDRLHSLIQQAICSFHVENEEELESSIIQISILKENVDFSKIPFEVIEKAYISLFCLLKENGSLVWPMELIFAWLEVIKQVPDASKSAKMTTGLLCFACALINRVLTISKSQLSQYKTQIEEGLKDLAKIEEYDSTQNVGFVVQALSITRSKIDELPEYVLEEEIINEGCWFYFELVRDCLSQDPRTAHLTKQNEFISIVREISKNPELLKEKLLDKDIALANKVLLSSSDDIGGAANEIRLKKTFDKLSKPRKGFTHCKTKSCTTCKYSSEDSNFERPAKEKVFEQKKVFEHKDQIDCHSKNVIYLITCKHCKEQYVGETKIQLKDRITQHLPGMDKKSPESAVAEHFNIEHGITELKEEDISVIGIDLLKQYGGYSIKIREQFWIDLLETKTKGMNRKNSVAKNAR